MKPPNGNIKNVGGPFWKKSPPTPLIRISLLPDLQRKGKEITNSSPDPIEDTSIKTPTQKSHKTKGKERVKIPWLVNSDAIAGRVTGWEWALPGHPIGAYDVPDILDKSVPRDDQCNEITDFLQPHINFSAEDFGVHQGVWAGQLYKPSPEKCEATEDAVKEMQD